MQYLSLILTLLISTSAISQKVAYKDGKIMYDNEELQTIEVKLTPNISTIRDKFSEWMSDHYDVNLEGKKLIFFKKDFMTAEGIIIPQVSPRKIDLRVKVDETKNGITTLHVFASYGYNNWITIENHPYAYDALRGIVYDFVSDYLPEYYYERVQDSKEKILDIEKESNKLEADLSDNKKEIEELLKKNDKLRLELEENITKLKKANVVLDVRKNEYQIIKKKVSGME